MQSVGHNRHRWKILLDDEVLQLFEMVPQRLREAWQRDKKHPKTFPMDTWLFFARLKENLKRELPVSADNKIRLPLDPIRLSDLIPEPAIKSAYEDHNQGSYADALTIAAKGYDEGYSAWRKIMRALDVAYLILHYGIEFAPMPRVHYLHRRLLEISECEHLRGLTPEGLVEFLDDVCPCGQRHNQDAIRKLKKRTPSLPTARNSSVL